MKKLLLLTIMLVLTNLSYGQFALANESFDGEVFPPSGWTVTKTHPTENWNVDFESAFVNWIAEDQDESLISPSFSLVGFTSAFLNVEVFLSYDFMVVEPLGDLFIKVSKDNGATWTEIWVEEDYGEFQDFDTLSLSLNLSEFVGEPDVKVRFQYFANDADAVYIDNVSVTACKLLSGIGISAISDQAATFFWDDTADNYDFQFGPAGFEFGTQPTTKITEPTTSLIGLIEASDYDFYVKSNCGETSNSGWQGPFRFITDLTSPADLDYSFDFEVSRLGIEGWTAAAPKNEGSEAWDIIGDLDTALTQDGTSIALCFGTEGIATDSWLYSRGLNLDGGTTVSIKYYVREAKIAGNGGTNNLEVKIGLDRTPAAQSTVVTPKANIGAPTAEEDVYVLKSFDYLVPATGVYYLGFNYKSTSQTATNNGALLLDAVSVSIPLSREDFLSSNFEVYPSPASDIITVSNKNNVSVNSITIVDLNGRVLNQLRYTNQSKVQINISNLSAGIYMMNINTVNGIATKKIIKK
jgi:hypothetical protein